MSRRRQRGAVAVLIAITIPAIVIIASGMLLIARILTTRQRLQYAADAVATEGAIVGKRQGLTGGGTPNSAIVDGHFPSLGAMQAHINAVRDGNLLMGGQQDWPVWSFEQAAGADWLRSQVHLKTTMLGYELGADAAVRVRQMVTNTPRRRPPTLMLVLDYSNSMNKSSAAFGQAIQQLRNVVNTFLDRVSTSPTARDGLRVGAVIYGTNNYELVQARTANESNNFAALRQTILPRPAAGDTNTGDAIAAATQMMLAEPDNFGRNIILVSDGAPCCADDAEPRALTAAADARAAGVQVFTVEVQHVDSSPAFHDSLVNIAGAINRHFHANNVQALYDIFAGVSVRPFCDIDAGQADDSYVYLRNAGGAETPVTRYTTAEEMSCPDHCDVIGFRYESGRTVLSPAACDLVLGNTVTAVVRWGVTKLVL